MLSQILYYFIYKNMPAKKRKTHRTKKRKGGYDRYDDLMPSTVGAVGSTAAEKVLKKIVKTIALSVAKDLGKGALVLGAPLAGKALYNKFKKKKK